MTKKEAGSTSTPKAEWGVRRISGRWQWDVPQLQGGSGSAWVELVTNAVEWQGYWFRVIFTVEDGDFKGFEIHRDVGAAPLGRRLLQAVPISSIERAARDHIRQYMQMVLAMPGAKALVEGWFRDFDDVGRDPKRDAWLAQIAKRYVETIGDPMWRSILEQEFNKEYDYIPELIKEARKRGLLTATTRGKAGGELTRRALDLLGISPFPQWTPEQNAAAHERDRPFRELTEQLRAGEITESEWGERLDKLTKEIYGDPGDSIQVNSGKD